jgi:predicted dehydrogenase
LVDLFQGIPLSGTKDHTFQPLASTWSDPNKGGGYGWGQLSHMFGGVFKISQLEAEKAFCFSVPSPTNVDYTNAISVKFTNGATGSFSGSAFVPKNFGGTFYITVHGTKGALYLDMEIKRERLLIRLNDGKEINDKIQEGDGTMAYSTENPLNTFVDICLNKDVENHGNAEIGLKTVKVLDAVYRSMKSEKMEKI